MHGASPVACAWDKKLIPSTTLEAIVLIVAAFWVAVGGTIAPRRAPAGDAWPDLVDYASPPWLGNLELTYLILLRILASTPGAVAR